MIRNITAIALLLIGTLEGMGWLVFDRYMAVLNQPLHFASIPIYELPAYALPAYGSALGPLLTFFAAGAILVWANFMTGYIVHSSPSYRTIVIDRRKSTDSTWYHLKRGFDFTDFPRAINFVVAIGTAFIIVLFIVFSINAALRYGTALAHNVRAGGAAPLGLELPQVTGIRLGLTNEASRTLPPWLVEANTKGRLAMIDSSPHSYAVSAIANKPAASQSTFLIDRAQTTFAELWKEPALQNVRPSSPPKRSPPAWLSWVINCLVAAIGIAFFSWAGRFVVKLADTRRRQKACLTQFNGESLKALNLPSSDAYTTLAALRSGTDVSLHIISEQEERYVYLPSRAFASLALSLRTNPNDQNTLRVSTSTAMTQSTDGDQVKIGDPK